MVRLCLRCHGRIDEADPLAQLGLKVGFCDGCLHAGVVLDGALGRRIKENRGFADRFTAAVHPGNVAVAESLLEEGLRLGFNSFEILFDVVQPILDRIGQLWSTSCITVAEEHQFTAFAQAILDAAFSCWKKDANLLQSQRPLILLVAAEANYHYLGLRMAELWLLSCGVPNFCVFPGIPNDEVLQLLEHLQPKVLGISVAQPEQFLAVHALETMLSDRYPRPLRMVLGGYAVRTGQRSAKPLRSEYNPDLTSLVERQRKAA